MERHVPNFQMEKGTHRREGCRGSHGFPAQTGGFEVKGYVKIPRPDDKGGLISNFSSPTFLSTVPNRRFFPCRLFQPRDKPFLRRSVCRYPSLLILFRACSDRFLFLTEERLFSDMLQMLDLVFCVRLCIYFALGQIYTVCL